MDVRGLRRRGSEQLQLRAVRADATSRAFLLDRDRSPVVEPVERQKNRATSRSPVPAATGCGRGRSRRRRRGRSATSTGDGRRTSSMDVRKARREPRREALGVDSGHDCMPSVKTCSHPCGRRTCDEAQRVFRVVAQPDPSGSRCRASDPPAPTAKAEAELAGIRTQRRSPRQVRVPARTPAARKMRSRRRSRRH